MTSKIVSSGKTSHRLSVMGLLVTLGIVYGDIGTSPLYVMRAIVGATSAVTSDYIIGAVSCIIWTLTFQTTLKYVVLALRADNNGEGGILALYALVRKHGSAWLYLLAIIGASTLVADGVITPSITVLSAIEGLRTYEPSTPVIPIAIAILTVLFFIQQYGTSAIGKLFGPLMLLWFSMIGILGLTHVSDSWVILKAFNPWYAVHLLATSPEWFLILGAVFLCTTGAEALYSDLGHCGKHNIRVSWAFVKTMLICNYLGQGAWIIAHAGQFAPGTNPFYAIMPHAFLPVGITMATIAAIVASQALISGSFTIFSEAMNLHFWPRQHIKYPTDIKGQLYIPFINISLYVLCIIVILFFQTSSNMEAAYGLAITVTMLMTTLLLGCYLKQNKMPWSMVIPVIGFFVVLEGIFFVANLAKFMHGGWVTMLLAGTICLVMYVWFNVDKIRNTFVERRDIRKYYDVLSDIKSDSSISKFATNIVYMSRFCGKYDVEQKVLYSIINKHPMRADHYILLHTDYEDTPNERSYDFYELIPGTLYRINLHLGFRVQPYVNLYLRQVIEDQVGNGKFALESGYDSLRRHHVAGNFIFVFIKRVYAEFNVFTPKARFIMTIYNLVHHLKQSAPKAMGLSTSNVFVEIVPLVVRTRKIERVTQNPQACPTDK
ncbi:KUP/HAK/KT family potassium transporter [Sodaliphilus pleomorphus]|uniref:Probable potassium transport system protein Kup n=1 Tax=Sodaliphilus pleomorphus TaxID=2606626 RepID=A0A6L5X9U6_9BACT|nr:KUP/HAK/KT family potassium transporter [Sodaliphilus pleomorphus]MSS17169.1 KUP/HAK/KT family potassium transporter [Sodaliphilus pleomorphus]